MRTRKSASEKPKNIQVREISPTSDRLDLPDVVLLLVANDTKFRKHPNTFMAKRSKKQQQIRTTQPIATRFERMTRHRAVREACHLLKKNIDDKNAYALIDLFAIEAEELAECGLCYELLCTIESRCYFLNNLYS